MLNLGKHILFQRSIVAKFFQSAQNGWQYFHDLQAFVNPEDLVSTKHKVRTDDIDVERIRR